MYSKDSESTDSPLVQELLWVEQNTWHALDAGLAEDNNWANSEQRVQFVYQSWVSLGRPPASVIKCMETEAIQGSPPTLPSHNIAIASSHFISPKGQKGHAVPQTDKLASKQSPAPSSESPLPPCPRPTTRYAQSASYLIHPLDLQDAHDGLIDDEDALQDDEEYNEDQDLANIEKEILVAKDGLATLKGMIINESKQSASMLRKLIKVKESELGEARRRRATLGISPRVQQHLLFVGERRARGMEVIQVA